MHEVPSSLFPRLSLLTGETVSTTNPNIGNAIGQSIDTDPLETQTDDNHLDTSLDETPPTHANKPTFSDGVMHIYYV